MGVFSDLKKLFRRNKQPYGQDIDANVLAQLNDVLHPVGKFENERLIPFLEPTIYNTRRTETFKPSDHLAKLNEILDRQENNVRRETYFNNNIKTFSTFRFNREKTFRSGVWKSMGQTDNVTTTSDFYLEPQPMVTVREPLNSYAFNNLVYDDGGGTRISNDLISRITELEERLKHLPR